MNLKGYFQESYTELVHKVTWPTWSELQNSAVLVMVATLIIACWLQVWILYLADRWNSFIVCYIKQKEKIPMSENIKKWYVLRAIGGKEKKVKEYIDSEVARLKLEDLSHRFLSLPKRFIR